MPTQRLTGSRIREKRLDRGLQQAAVAETVGISPSYLNLIEHNRRRIGGKLLADLARVLGVEASLLTEGADSQMLDQMRSAASKVGVQVELARAEEVAARYPGWSALIAAQSRRINTLEEQVQVLTDRMAYDPQLATALHEVISAVTAIRSSAAILVGPEKLDDDWQRRFHENIHNDSLRLASSSEALISYLEAPETEPDQVGSAFEQLEAFLAKTHFHIAALEQTDVSPKTWCKAVGLPFAVTELLERHATQYAHDAQNLPLAPFEKACRLYAYDPAALAQSFSTPLPAVLRRLATLPPGNGHPPMGLAVCDAAGALTLIKTVPGFSLPRSGGACPLWPLYAAMTCLARPMRHEIVLPGPNGTRMLCYAVASAVNTAQFDVPPAVQSIMLVVPDPPMTALSQIPVGVSCRICPRSDCASRREPAMMGVAKQTVL